MKPAVFCETGPMHLEKLTHRKDTKRPNIKSYYSKVDKKRIECDLYTLTYLK